MNKKQVIQLTENQLNQLIKESVETILNEGYSSMSREDSKQIDRIDDFQRTGETDVPFNVSGKAGRYIKLWQSVAPVYWDARNLLDAINNKTYRWKDETHFSDVEVNYIEKLVNVLKTANNIVNRLVDLSKMNMGQQPDNKYDFRHSTNKQERYNATRKGFDNYRKNSSNSYSRYDDNESD